MGNRQESEVREMEQELVAIKKRLDYLEKSEQSFLRCIKLVCVINVMTLLSLLFNAGCN